MEEKKEKKRQNIAKLSLSEHLGLIKRVAEHPFIKEVYKDTEHQYLGYSRIIFIPNIDVEGIFIYIESWDFWNIHFDLGNHHLLMLRALNDELDFFCQDFENFITFYNDK